MRRSGRRGSSSSQRPPQPSEEERSRRAFLSTKEFQSTAVIDFSFLAEMGILDEFLRLTERVGFTRAFWEIPSHHPTYRQLTIQFLSTLSLETLPDQSYAITFRLLGRNYQVTLSELESVFHLQRHDTEYLGYVSEDHETSEGETQTTLRAAFWQRITGQELPLTGADPRVNEIVHPVLRVICRFLGYSLCARGESSLRPATTNWLC